MNAIARVLTWGVASLACATTPLAEIVPVEVLQAYGRESLDRHGRVSATDSSLEERRSLWLRRLTAAVEEHPEDPASEEARTLSLGLLNSLGRRTEALELAATLHAEAGDPWVALGWVGEAVEIAENAALLDGSAGDRLRVLSSYLLSFFEQLDGLVLPDSPPRELSVRDPTRCIRSSPDSGASSRPGAS